MGIRIRAGLLASVALLAFSSAVAGTEPADKFNETFFRRALTGARVQRRDAALRRIVSEFEEHPDALRLLDNVTQEQLQRKRRDPEYLYNLIDVLGHIPGPAAAEALVPLLADRDHRIVIKTLAALTAGKPRAVIQHVHGLASSERFLRDFGFRSAVLDAVMSTRDREAVGFLVQQLDQLSGQSESATIDYLERVTGKSFGTDAETWLDWWTRHGDNFEFASRSTFPRDESSVDSSSSASFFGVPITAARVVFVVDRSHSMSEPLDLIPTRTEAEYVVAKAMAAAHSRTRLHRAKQELSAAIKRLDPAMQFNIVVFDGRVAVWQKGLVDATLPNKAAAYRFIASITPGDHTAWYDALQAAFEIDDNVEAILFLTDGEPTVGKIVSAKDIVQAVTTENEFRNIAVHTIGLGVGHLPAQFLATLAEQNRGVFRSVGRPSVLAAADGRHKPSSALLYKPETAVDHPLPAIEDVRYFRASRVAGRLKADELVLGVEIDGQSRAYPLNMLTGPDREIINDTLAGRPIAATW